MLEIRRGIATRSYENSFFREFAHNLSKMFERYSIDGILIASSECEASPNLKIDVLLVTRQTVCIIDFKNFGGEIILPTNDNDFAEGKWVTNLGDIIKGGSHINPYKQLYQQKKAFTWVFHNSHLKNDIKLYEDRFNPSHVKKIVCFQKPITLINSIPDKYEIDFFITDTDRYLETLKDILDVNDEDNHLSPVSFDAFKTVYKANNFSLDETYDYKEIDIEIHGSSLNYDSLYPNQKSAIEEISRFLKSTEDKVFILQGTSMSGKTHILPYIENLAFDNDFTQVEYFASSTRVTNNLLSSSGLEFNSIYASIYGGKHQIVSSENTDKDESKKNSNQDSDNDSDEENNNLEIVPLKTCEASNKMIFIIDEAQLVSDSYYQSFDLRFGSGKLLEDFITFANLTGSDRKIIFVGDSFQLSLGRDDESSLNPSYFIEKYKIQPKVVQLIDKPYTPIIEQALTTVSAIRNLSFNLLDLQQNNGLQFIDKSDALSFVTKSLSKNHHSHILTFSNEEAQKVNLWIKKSIINTGDDISANDLILINNNFKVEDKANPFTDPKNIYNGQFATVNAVEQSFDEFITPKNKEPIQLTFRKIDVTMVGSGHLVTLLSLENYRLSKKGELSDNEVVALKILQNIELKKALKESPFKHSNSHSKLIHSTEYKQLNEEIKDLEARLKKGEKVKTKLTEKERLLRKTHKYFENRHKNTIKKELLTDTSSQYFKYKNYAQIRFGWAMTVHKSISYKWDEVLFNVSQGENAGRSNKGYFRWLYTGLTRATEKATLINYEPISPFSKVIIKDENKGVFKKDFYLITDKETKLDDELVSYYSQKFSYDNSDFIAILVQIYQLISNKIKGQDWKIHAINHTNYQAVYEFEDKNQSLAKVSIYYNGKGQVRLPNLIKADNENFGTEVIGFLTKNSAHTSFDFITDGWRKSVYHDLAIDFAKDNYQITQIIQESYKDKVSILKDDKLLNIDIYYDANGFFTNIIATSYNDVSIWDYFQRTVHDLY